MCPRSKCLPQHSSSLSVQTQALLIVTWLCLINQEVAAQQLNSNEMAIVPVTSFLLMFRIRPFSATAAKPSLAVRRRQVRAPRRVAG